MNYKLAYAVGFHPWEDAESCVPFSTGLLDLVEQEEHRVRAPFGRALDIGTGAGIWGIALAKRGWEVTGIDNVDKALRRARDRIAAKGVHMELVHGDVTALPDAAIGTGYRLIVDTGTFHDFTPEQRSAMGRGVDAVATDDATIILTVWPDRRRPLIRGVDLDGIEAAFPGWHVENVGSTGYTPPKVLDLVLRPNEHFFRLRRR